VGADFSAAEFVWDGVCADFVWLGVEAEPFVSVAVALISVFGSAAVGVTFVVCTDLGFGFVPAASSATELTAFNWVREGGSRLIESLLSLPVSLAAAETTDMVD